jgi:hypothetical protein
MQEKCSNANGRSMKLPYCIFTILLVLTLVGRSKAQKGRDQFLRPPETVIAVLDSLYPGVKDVQWSRKRKQYTADFNHGARNLSISLNSKGKILTRLEEINYNLLPDRIRQDLEQSYSTYKIVMVLRHDANAKLNYHIEIIQGRLHYLLNYNSNGNLVRQYELLKVDQFARSSDEE